MRSGRRRSRWLVTGGCGVLLALGAFIVVAPALLRPGAKRLPLVHTPADYGIVFETIAFRPPDEPITLRAWWMPAPSAKAAIMLVHGGGDDNRSLPYADGLALAGDLVAHGYTVLALDLRNYGESDASPEGVTFGDLESNDLIGAMNYVAARGEGLRYGAVGFSMGGETVLYAAARDPRLEAVVTTDTFADSRGVAANFVSASTGLPRLLVVPLLWSAEHLHGMPLGRGRAIDVVGAIPPRPALLIQNEADPIVSMEDCRQLAAAMPGSQVWITPAPPAGSSLRVSQGRWGMHTQSYKLDPQAYVEHVTRFFDARFVGTRNSGANGGSS
jgi:uncharacterized protein